MIEKVSLSSVNKKNTPKNGNSVSQPAFKGGLVDGLVWGVQKCEQHPMLNVTVLDLLTAIIPRTIIETVAGSKVKDENGNPVLDENGKQKRQFNIFGGFEALRREGSGLVVNCIIPSFIVMGMAALAQKPIMGKFNKSSLVNTWANGEVYDKINSIYKPSEPTLESYKDFYKRMLVSLEGVDGEAYNGGTKRFADILAQNPDKIKNLASTDKILETITFKPEALKQIDNLAQSAFEGKKELAAEAYKKLVGMTHISENIRFINDEKYLSNNLESVFEDSAKVLHGVKKEGIKTSEELAKYFSKAKKLVNWKSIGGLGVIIPLAISMQPINRWLTHKMSGRKGAPIYNDFADRKEDRELTPKEKAQLLKQKFISVGSMLGVAGLSMFMDKPSLKSLFQFKGLFPTMDQARIISTATFASRMAAAEDRNELREATIRDIATFSSFYFLGDYAAKAIATLIEHFKPGVTLINRLKKSDANANVLQKFWNWAKHTSLKSTDELASASDKRLRTLCQIGNLAFSLISLGVFIPLYTRTQTQKKAAQENLANLKTANTNGSTPGGAGTSAANSPFSSATDNLAAAKTSFKAFLNS